MDMVYLLLGIGFFVACQGMASLFGQLAGE